MNKTCRCGKEYIQYSTMQTRCSFCLAKRAKDTREKKERKDHRKAKEGLKTWSQWNSEAQRAYNKVIRLLDRHEPCISCGREDWEIKEYLVGGKWDCGHYKTRGAFPELRFALYNSHKQCKSCNGGSGKYTKKNHTVGKDYRINLIEKIGLENVEYLEGPHPLREYSIEDLKEIKQGFNQWARELEKALET